MDRSASADTIDIGRFALDKRAGTLSHNGAIVPLRAKTWALLCQLADNPGRVISKDELLDALWPDVTVSEDSLTQAVRDLRKAIGDEDQKLIRTVSRRGYMFVPDSPQAGPRIAASGEPSVAVLPFLLHGGDDNDRILVDGIIEEITNGLAHFKSVTVIARASAFSFPAAGRSLPKSIGEQLGADHLVEGSFRKTVAGFRISVTLTHAPSGRQIWGDQLDCSEAELLDIDAVISRRIIARLVSNIEQSVLRSIAGTPPANLKAFEQLLRGKMYLRGYDENANSKAIACLRQSVELDPEFGLAHAYLALAEVIIGDYGAAPRPILESACDRARLALALSPEEARCHRIMGMIQLYLREHNAAESHMRSALELNPHDTDSIAQMGFILAMRGRAVDGLLWLERSIVLNPFRPAWYDSDLAVPLYALGRYDDAIEVLGRIPDNGAFQDARLAAAFAMVGNQPKAAFHVERALDAMVGLDLIDYLRKVAEFEHEADFLHLAEGIRRATEALRLGRQTDSQNDSGKHG